MVTDLAASHPFTAWGFAHRGAAFPYARPAQLRASQEAEDAPGNYNVITSEQFPETWTTSALTMRSKLDLALAAVDIDQLAGVVQPRRGNAQLQTMSRAKRMGLIRVMVAYDFDHRQDGTERVCHQANMQGYCETARRAAAMMKQSNPYRDTA